MRFGPRNTKDAIGTILAHSTTVANRTFTKGQILGKEEIDELVAGGVDTLTVATLDDGDVLENEAASVLASVLVTSGVRISRARTGRVNFHATDNGIFWSDRGAVDLFNSIDTGITLATLAEGRSVQSGEMVATVKIIPLAVSGQAINAVLSLLVGRAILTTTPYMRHDVVLISTLLPALKQSVIEKTMQSLARRLVRSQSVLNGDLLSEHRPDALAEKIRAALRIVSSRPRLIAVFGASAVIDERDVIPEAIRLAGGRVVRVGMPVDPGNLLVLGEVEGVPVVGAPGCARSPKENGFDWVINRLLTGERPDAIHMAGMGVGGLLKEIPTRPSPRNVTKQVLSPVSRCSPSLDVDTQVSLAAAWGRPTGRPRNE